LDRPYCRRHRAFDASQKFHEGETVDGVKIDQLGDNFRENFSNKVEECVPPVELASYDLRGDIRNNMIFSALTGREVEFSLAHLWALLKAQGHGNDEGPLLVRGRPNIIYIRGTSGMLWAVLVDWAVRNGWCVVAFSVEHRRMCGQGSRVFARDS
jgi:hypothetical protein